MLGLETRDISGSLKDCKTCRATKASSEFYSQRRECKDCTKTRVRASRLSDLDTYKARQRAKYRRNRENPEWVEAERLRLADFRRAHPEQAAQYRRDHSEEAKDRVRQWEAANPERARLNHLEAVRRRRTRIRQTRVGSTPITLWQGKVAYWGDRCWMCHGPWSQVDHVKPVAKGGAHVLANLRPICGDCNKRKADRWPVQLRAA